jgi:hypothetical protein
VGFSLPAPLKALAGSKNPQVTAVLGGFLMDVEKKQIFFAILSPDQTSHF